MSRVGRSATICQWKMTFTSRTLHGAAVGAHHVSLATELDTRRKREIARTLTRCGARYRLQRLSRKAYQRQLSRYGVERVSTLLETMLAGGYTCRSFCCAERRWIPARTNRSQNPYRRLRAAHHQLLSNGTKAQI